MAQNFNNPAGLPQDLYEARLCVSMEEKSLVTIQRMI